MQFTRPFRILPMAGIAALVGAVLLPPLTAVAAEPDAKAAAEVPCEVVVLNFEAKGLPENEKHVAEILTNTFAAEIAESANCKVITQNDLKSMTEFESQRQLCGSQESCMAEIGSALGVDIVIGGVVGRLGSSYTLQIMKRNVTKGVVEARVDDTISGDALQLQVAAKNAARVLYGLKVEGGADPAAATGAKGANAAGTGAGKGDGAVEGEEASSGGAGLLFAGIGVAGAGALILAIGGSAAAAIDFLVLTNKALDGGTKDAFALGGIVALIGGGVIGVVGLTGGGALAAMGALSE